MAAHLCTALRGQGASKKRAGSVLGMLSVTLIQEHLKQSLEDPGVPRAWLVSHEPFVSLGAQSVSCRTRTSLAMEAQQATRSTKPGQIWPWSLDLCPPKVCSSCRGGSLPPCLPPWCELSPWEVAQKHGKAVLSSPLFPLLSSALRFKK